ncbi:MAG: hypothetical protein PHT40_00745 [Patescibacteria group bacterium]|nr:hypothetical protein [Patescibacteria group bacterium]
MGYFSAMDGSLHVETEPIRGKGGEATRTKIKITGDKLYICAEIEGSPSWPKIKKAVENLAKKGRLATMDVDRRIAEELEKLG